MSGFARAADAVNTFRRHPTHTPGQRTLIPHELYDTFRFPATYNTPWKHFTIPVNGNLASGVQKTEIHTNMVDSGKIEAQQFFLFDRIQVKMKAPATENNMDDIASWYRVLNSSRFRVIVGTAKYVAEFHGSVFTPNIPQASAGTTSFPILAALAIVPLEHNLGQDIVLCDPNGVPQNFHIEQACEASEVSAALTTLNGNTVDMVIKLKGYLERPKG